MDCIQEDSDKPWVLEGKFSWETWLKQKEFSRVGSSLKKRRLGYKHKQSHTVGGQEVWSETNLAKQHGLQRPETQERNVQKVETRSHS